MEKAFLLLIGTLVLTCAYMVSTQSCYAGDYGPTDAQAKFTVRVVDEVGQPVEGAKVWARFNLTLQGKFKVDEKLTNATGEAVVSGRCDLSTLFAITKDGYYETSHVVEYRVQRDEIKDDKWQPYGSVVQYTLKKIHKPIPMTLVARFPFRVPNADQAFGYDMEAGALVEPYGKGKVADFYIKYTFTEEDGVLWKTMTLSFPNCLDGAYLFDRDTYSFFQSPYHADINGEYLKSITLKCTANFKWKEDARTGKRYRVSAGGESVCDEKITQDQGLVLRTRTKVDAEGNLISAHYGKIYGEIGLHNGLLREELKCDDGNAKLFFNPAENDTNLEYDCEEYRHYLEERRRGINWGGTFSL